MEIASMSILDVPDLDDEANAAEADAYGFELVLSEPVHGDWSAAAANVEVVQYDYNYWWEYGSPEQHMETLEVEGGDPHVRNARGDQPFSAFDHQKLRAGLSTGERTELRESRA